MSKLFKLREWLNLEDAARKLSYSFQEEVTEKDILKLVLHDLLPISLMHGPLWVEDVALVTALYGKWFNGAPVNHSTRPSFKDLINQQDNHSIREVFYQWKDRRFEDFDYSNTTEDDFNKEEKRLDSVFDSYLEIARNLASHEEVLAAVQHDSELLDLAKTIADSVVFLTFEDYLWDRFGGDFRGMVAQFGPLADDGVRDKWHVTDLIPTSIAYRFPPGIHRLSPMSEYLGPYLLALANGDEISIKELRRDAGKWGLQRGTILYKEDGSNFRIRENPGNYEPFEDERFKSPFIAPDKEHLVIFRKDLDAFERRVEEENQEQPVTKSVGSGDERVFRNPPDIVQKIIGGMALILARTAKYNIGGKPNAKTIASEIQAEFIRYHSLGEGDRTGLSNIERDISSAWKAFLAEQD